MNVKKIVILITVLIILNISVVSYSLDLDHNFRTPPSTKQSYVQAIENKDISLNIDGKIVRFEEYLPLIVSGRLFLPLRSTLIMLGVPNDNEHIIWNGDKKTIAIIKGSTTIVLQINNNIAYINDNQIEIDEAPFIKDGRTYVPVRFVAEALNYDVAWNAETQQVILKVLDLFKDAFILNAVTEAFTDYGGGGSRNDTSYSHPDGFGSDGYLYKGGHKYYYAGLATEEQLRLTGGTGFGYLYGGISTYMYNGSIYKITY
jgi:hypothetical protein